MLQFSEKIMALLLVSKCLRSLLFQLIRFGSCTVVRHYHCLANRDISIAFLSFAYGRTNRSSTESRSTGSSYGHCCFTGRTRLCCGLRQQLHSRLLRRRSAPSLFHAVVSISFLCFYVLSYRGTNRPFSLISLLYTLGHSEN